MADVIRSAAEDVIGYTKRKKKDWFDDNAVEIKQLLDKKNKAHAAYIGSPSSDYLHERWQTLHSQIERVLQEMENQ